MQLEALWKSNFPTLEREAELAVRVDGATPSSAPLPGVVFVVHQTGGAYHTLRLTFRRTDTPSASAVTVRGVLVPPPSASQLDALPHLPRDIGPANVLRCAGGAVSHGVLADAGLGCQGDSNVPASSGDGSGNVGGGADPVGAAGPTVAVPTARALLGQRWVPVRRFAAPYLKHRFGTAWVLNLPVGIGPDVAAALGDAATGGSIDADPDFTSMVSPPEAAAARRSVRDAALHRSSNTCPGAQATAAGACLDGWLWPQDWLNFNQLGEYRWPFSPPDRGVSMATARHRSR